MPEQVFFHEAGVYVRSTTIALPGSVTFATANVTSVRTAVWQPQREGLWLPIWLGAIGVFFAVSGLFCLSDPWLLGVFFLVASLVPTGLGIYFARSALASRRRAPVYLLYVASAAGELEGLRSLDETAIERVAGAIRQAITARG